MGSLFPPQRREWHRLSSQQMVITDNVIKVMILQLWINYIITFNHGEDMKISIPAAKKKAL